MAWKLKGLRGMHMSLSKMHSAKGTATFAKLSKGQQKQWSSQDAKRSRPALMKGAGMHGRGGSH